MIKSWLIKDYLMEQQKIQLATDYRIPFSEEERWRNYLEEYGFVVIANYIDDQEELQKYVDSVWKMIETLSQGRVKRNDEETQIHKQNYPHLSFGGLIHYVGHSQLQWDLRKRCKPIFQKIWNTQDVKSSFDGLCFMNGALKFQKLPHNNSLHTDQSSSKDYLWSYQGIMALTDACENQGGFVCVPKTHKYHHKYFEEKGLLDRPKDFYMVPPQDKQKQPLCFDQKINSKGGDFILFDSRLFHCNTLPQMNSVRICTYICMVPSQTIPQDVLEQRKRAVEEKRTTSHHPGEFRLFQQLPYRLKNPQQFRKIKDSVNKFEMDEEIESLI